MFLFIFINKKRKNNVKLGNRTLGYRMVGADRSTELPHDLGYKLFIIKVHNKFKLIVGLTGGYQLSFYGKNKSTHLLNQNITAEKLLDKFFRVK